MAVFGIIYCITNTVNRKQYVGQTTTKLSYRWRKHLYYAAIGVSSALYNSIRKYGKGAFSIKQIDSANTIEELNKKEITHIELLSTMSPNGLNLSTGGDNFKRSQETCRKLSENGKRQLHPRQTVCRRGHALTPENSYIRPNGQRNCRECLKLIRNSYGWSKK